MLASNHNPLGALAWQNEREGWLLLGEAQADAGPFRLETHQGVTCAWWQGPAGEMENYLMLSPGYIGELEKAIPALVPLIQANGAVTVLRYLQTDERPEWRQVLTRSGFILADTAPLMATHMSSSPAFPRENTQVRAERVEVACEYQEACALTQRIFGGPLSVTRFFAQPELTQMYAAWLGKNLVAAATLWPFCGTAGLYSVGTEPNLRRQGIAAAVMNRLLADAWQDGFSIATLRTTDNLTPVYVAGGFQTVGRVVRWVRLGR